jgi:hypothetical protein
VDHVPGHQIQPGGKVRVTDVEAEAREAGLLRPGSLLKDSRPAEHAVDHLKIEKIPEGDGDGGRVVWWWCRPSSTADDAAVGGMADHVASRRTGSGRTH